MPRTLHDRVQELIYFGVIVHDAQDLVALMELKGYCEIPEKDYSTFQKIGEFLLSASEHLREMGSNIEVVFGSDKDFNNERNYRLYEKTAEILGPTKWLNINMINKLHYMFHNLGQGLFPVNIEIEPLKRFFEGLNRAVLKTIRDLYEHID